MRFSEFGTRFRGNTGIGTLMQDLKPSAPSAGTQYALGGGNPAIIPAVSERFRQSLSRLCDSDVFNQTFATYDGPAGDQRFIAALVNLLNRHYDWTLNPENVVLTNGSQNAFFMLFNLFAGQTQGQHRHILLPIAPEYIGYEDVSIGDPIFRSVQPDIELLDDQLYKYRLNTTRLKIESNTAALCVSRPTNPTGNVITDEELLLLNQLAQDHDVPLIIDNAYGAPFPNIIQTPAKLIWNKNIILSMSVSKMGLPGARTGIVIADEEIIRTLSEMNSVFNLAPSSLAPAMLEPLFTSGEILQLCEEQIRPFYEERSKIALQWFREAFAGLPAKAHKPEGSIFLWLWFPKLNISSQAFYERLKKRGVIVVPGHYFFPGMDKSWPHVNQCIRVNIAGDSQSVQTGIGIIADELRATTT
ncbi:MAG: valine--pyruvate transaminase [Gammaproteobacteria bacterium]|nr:valine--pyruvate transaminase [Gammaproteobacteria bacterium]